MLERRTFLSVLGLAPLSAVVGRLPEKSSFQESLPRHLTLANTCGIGRPIAVYDANGHFCPYMITLDRLTGKGTRHLVIQRFSRKTYVLNSKDEIILESIQLETPLTIVAADRPEDTRLRKEYNPTEFYYANPESRA